MHRSLYVNNLSFSGGLNTQEDGENLLGYSLYSSALADMLSDPSLNMPITVGLFARWGSGKSFLLSKLRGTWTLNSEVRYSYRLIFAVLLVIAYNCNYYYLFLQSFQRK